MGSSPNYGANHFIIGRDPHGPGKDSQGRSFYASRDVQELFHSHEAEIGVQMIPHREMVICPAAIVMRNPPGGEWRGRVYPCIGNDRDRGFPVSGISGFRNGSTYPEVAQILIDAHPAKTARDSAFGSPGCRAPASRRSPMPSRPTCHPRQTGEVLDGMW